LTSIKCRTSVIALDHARSIFYVVQATSEVFGPQSENKEFRKKWIMNMYTF